MFRVFPERGRVGEEPLVDQPNDEVADARELNDDAAPVRDAWEEVWINVPIKYCNQRNPIDPISNLRDARKNDLVCSTNGPARLLTNAKVIQ